MRIDRALQNPLHVFLRLKSNVHVIATFLQYLDVSIESPLPQRGPQLRSKTWPAVALRAGIFLPAQSHLSEPDRLTVFQHRPLVEFFTRTIYGGVHLLFVGRLSGRKLDHVTIRVAEVD